MHNRCGQQSQETVPTLDDQTMLVSSAELLQHTSAVAIPPSESRLNSTRCMDCTGTESRSQCACVVGHRGRTGAVRTEHGTNGGRCDGALRFPTAEQTEGTGVRCPPP
jgi:hypothetical protein